MTENITFPYTLDADGKYFLQSRQQFKLWTELLFKLRSVVVDVTVVSVSKYFAQFQILMRWSFLIKAQNNESFLLFAGELIPFYLIKFPVYVCSLVRFHLDLSAF